MPRSAIRRPSPELDFSPYFRTVEDLPETLTSETLFKNQRPLEIEIGSGKGLFMATASQASPQHNFMGIEIATKYAKHAAARLARAECRNAIMVAGNAEPLFQKAIPAASLEAVHVYFPDPWWKKRHRKRRVVNEVSVRNYCDAIRSGGRFHFWTDVLDYFELTIEMIADIVPEFGVPIPEEEIEATHDLDYRTHFERRSRKHRIPVYRVRFEKR
ncbi:MAG: tRNA (guanosine(46)-N7)-methyltransferase TrmB [Pirellulaceae bacterium]